MIIYIIGIIVHIIFFMSIFDIYFRTPVVHGMESHCHYQPTKAKRLVLFIADGLRAETFYDFSNQTTRAPYLRYIIETEGTWGVSHTRVPTESRPGHVALIAGLYEDPSAITCGWKENPVEFDSVFNQSRHTYSWGSPDILPMFASGASKDHVDTYMYTSAEQDFGRKDASQLDVWVFDKVASFFSGAENDEELREKLAEDRIILFLHLLGLDTNGHAHKPYSEYYLNNIEVVDNGIEKIVKQIEKFYGDGRTAYIFTSDHGMTNWGSHGAGDPSETETPIVAWGAGIAPPQDPSNFKDRMIYDPRVEQWGLNHVRRHDIFQADVAPLISSVLGIPIPVNSVGVLPVEYLHESAEFRAHALYANVQQMLAHYQVKQKKKEEESLYFLFRPFYSLLPDKQFAFMSQIKKNIVEENYEEAVELSNYLISLSLEGIEYFHTYDCSALIVIISLGFVGWITLLVCYLLKDYSSVVRIAGNTVEGRRTRRRSFLFGFILAIWAISTLAFLIAEHHPWQNYLYFLVPVCLWTLVYIQIRSLHLAWLIVKSFNMVSEVAVRVVFIFFGIEIMVFSFFLRGLLSIVLISLAIWPVMMHSVQEQAEKSLHLCWIGSCILLASFTYMPVVGQEAVYPLVIFAGVVAFVLIGVGLLWCSGEESFIKNIPKIVFLQGLMILCSIFNVYMTSESIDQGKGLLLVNKCISWLILGASFIVPLFVSRHIMSRLLSISSALLCPFLLLSIRQEGFFYIALSIAMFLWLLLEYAFSGVHVQISALRYAVWHKELENDEDRLIEWSDVRRTYFFLFFIILSFFGIGNVASVNSFDPKFVYCFVTVFTPFLMGALLLLKIIIPFLLVTCFFRAVCTLIQVPLQAIFYVFLILSDIMALHFFFLVRNKGAWLEIGTSLSHYVICMTTTVFLIVLMLIARLLTTTYLAFWPDTSHLVMDLKLPSVVIGRLHKD